MNKRQFVMASAVALVAPACTTTNPSTRANPEAQRGSINASVDSALTKLYNQVPGSRESVARARGVLVFPNVVSAGLIVGGSYGEGALRIGPRTAGYYSTTAVSAGLLAGGESRAVYVLFMTQEALEKFQASNGWTVGADASVTLLRAGADANVTSQVADQQVIGYVLANVGLMANLSIDGTKVSKLNI